MQNHESSILVVDDELEIRELILDYLRECGDCTVYEADCGKDALEILKKTHIDLVLSDINMPGMKGFDFLKRVKERHPSVKRVLITAYNVEDYLDLALKYDIGNIFVKTIPFNFQELSSILNKLLRNNIFGLDHYFGPESERSQFRISTSRCLDKDAEAIVQFIDDKRQANRLALVVVELLTNAIFYGIRNEIPDQKELWKHDFVLPEDKAITVSVAKDLEKYGISVSDTGGRLKKTDVLYWLNRQIARDQNGLPLGLYDSHGRGFFITRKYIDRLVINIDQAHRTEVIVINYYSETFKGHKPLYINEL